MWFDVIMIVIIIVIIFFISRLLIDRYAFYETLESETDIGKQKVMPSGIIVLWISSTKLPEGWAVCNGNNGTPNLNKSITKEQSKYKLVYIMKL